jgi:hypothetical protein
MGLWTDMKTINFLTLAAMLLLVTSFSEVASGAVIYGTTAVGSNPRTAEYSTVSNDGFRTFDNFTPGFNATVQKVSFSGHYVDFNNPQVAPTPQTDTFTIAFWANNGGLPGSLLSSETFNFADLSPTLLGTGGFNLGTVYQVSRYSFTANLTTAFSVNQGTQYWISILGVRDANNPIFGWFGATGGDNVSVQQSLGASYQVTGTSTTSLDRAVVIEGSVAVPEPGSVALCFFGLAAVIARARKLRK